MPAHDAIVIGGGVIGMSTAWQLAQLGAKNVLVLERRRIGEGTTAQSSGILRTHYSVPQNVELARRSWAMFENFAAALDDDEASAGLVRCGYLISAPAGDKLAALQATLSMQEAQGIPLQRLSRADASARLPICRFDDAALIGFEPEAGYADAYLVTTSFARAARRLGVKVLEGTAVQALLREGTRVVGVRTAQADFHAGVVVSAQNIWARELQAWAGLQVPLHAERHTVLALQGPQPYTPQMPVFKDLGSGGMLYGRSYGGTQMLVSEGTAAEVLGHASGDMDDAQIDVQADVSMDQVAHIGAQVAERFPSFETAGLASSWTGVYDVTPDWNPVLGRVPDVPGLVLAFGFSGHGFKLSPAVGRVLAQEALGLATDVSLAPYALTRFAQGRPLVGRYGQGAVS
jgi:sarcosine oxidase, subunit beta